MKTTKWKLVSEIKTSGQYYTTFDDIYPNVVILDYNSETNEWSHPGIPDTSITGVQYFMAIPDLPK